MVSLSFIVGIIGNVVSLLVFASPIKTFAIVVKKKSTENFKGVPYITTLLSSSSWTFYGLLDPGGLLVATVNGAGVVLELIYVTLFLIYAPRDKKVQAAKLAAILDVGFLGSVIAITLLAIHGKLRITIVGLLCAILSVGMYAAPLSAMKTVIKTKSVKYMPFLLSFFLFLNGGIWAFYAVLVKDFYVGVPNSVGFVLGAAQLIIYAIYKDKPMLTKSMEASEKEGLPNLGKDGIEMGSYKDEGDEEANVKSRSLTKIKSLPKPTINRQYSLQKIMKTLSLSACELNASWANLERDAGDGKIDDNP